MTRPAPSPIEQVIAEIEAWTFFHLGSDATLVTDRFAGGLRVHFSHTRIHEYRIQLSDNEIAAYAEAPAGLEARLLAELARHRRSG